MTTEEFYVDCEPSETVGMNEYAGTLLERWPMVFSRSSKRSQPNKN